MLQLQLFRLTDVHYIHVFTPVLVSRSFGIFDWRMIINWRRSSPPAIHIRHPDSVTCAGTFIQVLQNALITIGHFFSTFQIFVCFGFFQPREKGRMRFHKLQNVQIALDFLKRRQVSKEFLSDEHVFLHLSPKLKLRCNYFRSNWSTSGMTTSPTETPSWPSGSYGPSSCTSRYSLDGIQTVCPSLMYWVFF